MSRPDFTDYKGSLTKGQGLVTRIAVDNLRKQEAFERVWGAAAAISANIHSALAQHHGGVAPTVKGGTSIIADLFISAAPKGEIISVGNTAAARNDQNLHPAPEGSKPIPN